MTTTPHADVRLETWTATEALARLDDLVAVYKEAFLDLFEADPVAAAADRRVHVRSHLRRVGTAVVAALDDDGQLLGFGYGGPGRAGQWWHDTVSRGLTRAERARWLADCFEIAELHVRPRAQRTGVGRALLRSLLATSTASTATLSALDDPSLPARHLYDTEGFHLLRSSFSFPGSPRPYAILVIDL